MKKEVLQDFLPALKVEMLKLLQQSDRERRVKFKTTAKQNTILGDRNEKRQRDSKGENIKKSLVSALLRRKNRQLTMDFGLM